MKAVIDQDTCIGCGLCPQICPDVFKMEGDKAVVYVKQVSEGLEPACKDAADQCPVNAIKIE